MLPLSLPSSIQAFSSADTTYSLNSLTISMSLFRLGRSIVASCVPATTTTFSLLIARIKYYGYGLVGGDNLLRRLLPPGSASLTSKIIEVDSSVGAIENIISIFHIPRINLQPWRTVTLEKNILFSHSHPQIAFWHIILSSDVLRFLTVFGSIKNAAYPFGRGMVHYL